MTDSEIYYPTPTLSTVGSDTTCSSCIFKQKNQFGKNYYCLKKPHKNPAFGYLKIKPDNKACEFYKLK